MPLPRSAEQTFTSPSGSSVRTSRTARSSLFLQRRQDPPTEVLADGDCAHSQLLRRRGDLSPGEQDGTDDGGDAGEGEGGWARRHDAQSCLERWADMV
ncbi:hypothetical protein E4U54_001951, partial [Claviceps lovelessii]